MKFYKVDFRGEIVVVKAWQRGNETFLSALRSDGKEGMHWVKVATLHPMHGNLFAERTPFAVTFFKETNVKEAWVPDEGALSFRWEATDRPVEKNKKKKKKKSRVKVKTANETPVKEKLFMEDVIVRLASRINEKADWMPFGGVMVKSGWITKKQTAWVERTPPRDYKNLQYGRFLASSNGLGFVGSITAKKAPNGAALLRIERFVA